MHADNINEFKSENISKKIQDEAGDLIDGEVYFINFWYIYNDSCCYSEIYNSFGKKNQLTLVVDMNFR